MDSLTKVTSTILDPVINTVNINHDSTALPAASTEAFKSQKTTHLDFSHRTHLTDKELINEIAGSSVIEKLTFKGCTCLKLKDKTIRVLAERFNHLKELDLSGCTRITNRVIKGLKDSAMPLKKLVLDHIPGLSLKTLRMLGAKGIAFTAKGSSFRKYLFNLTEHIDYVTALIGLSDGYLASASRDKTIKIWDPASGTCLATLTGHIDYVNKLIELSDRRLVSASSDCTIKLWNPTSGTCVDTLREHAGSVTTLIELSDGRLASGSYVRTIKLWDPTSGTCLAILTGHSREVYPLIELSDGRLASGSDDKTIKLWNPISGTCLDTLIGHTRSVTKLIELSDGRLASASGDTTIKLWDLASGTCMATLIGHSN
jgi:WD40 repeat protein